MPHVPLFVSQDFDGRTGRGVFGDVIAEIDWSVGQVLEALQRCGIDEQTLVIFTSDNGPWLSYGNHAGSAKPLREGKGTTWDGGVRVPFVARWPGKIPAGSVSSEPVATIDILPTIAEVCGVDLPPLPIDGLSIWPILSGQSNAKSPHDALWFYWGAELQGVRSGPYKLHFPHAYRSVKEVGHDGQPGPYQQLKTDQVLYDLAQDIGESQDVSTRYPDVVKKLQEHADRARRELGDSLTGKKGQAVRPAGSIK